jgi:hypothetical protein
MRSISSCRLTQPMRCVERARRRVDSGFLRFRLDVHEFVMHDIASVESSVETKRSVYV